MQQFAKPQVKTDFAESTLEVVAQMSPPEKARLYRLWERFGALPPVRHRFNRRRGILPSGISNEDLATRFQNLAPNRQDELLSLTAEEMLHQFQQIYMDYHFPKFRPRKTNNHTRRRPPTNKVSPLTPHLGNTVTRHGNNFHQTIRKPYPGIAATATGGHYLFRT